MTNNNENTSISSYENPWTVEEAIEFAKQNPKEPYKTATYRCNTYWSLETRQTGRFTFSGGSVYLYAATNQYEASIKTSKRKLYLCIGGPFDGEHKCIEQAEEQGYHSFNASNSNCGHSCILIHKNSL